VDSYQFLVREYPASKYCQDAILRIAKLQRDGWAMQRWQRRRMKIS